MIVVAIALAGGCGAAARAVLDGVVSASLARRTDTRGSASSAGGSSPRAMAAGWPWSTILINLTGSLALGIVIGCSTSFLPQAWQLILGVGFLGGYTTFSTVAVQAAQMWLAGRRGTSAGYSVGLLVGASLSAGLGMWIGGALPPC